MKHRSQPLLGYSPDTVRGTEVTRTLPADIKLAAVAVMTLKLPNSKLTPINDQAEPGHVEKVYKTAHPRRYRESLGPAYGRRSTESYAVRSAFYPRR